MATDSADFRTADQLAAAGSRLVGNVWITGEHRHLPLYEAKMLHQFDHRFGTYQGATEQHLNAATLPQPTSDKKHDASFVVQPRYWVDEHTVTDAIPRFPEPVAEALGVGDAESVRYALCVWHAGYLHNRGHAMRAELAFETASLLKVHPKVVKALKSFGANVIDVAVELERLYPLDSFASELPDIATAPDDEVTRAGQRLLDQFATPWLAGWRRTARATDARTIIASALPRTAVGDSIFLFFVRPPERARFAELLCAFNSLAFDFVTRQKMGGTNASFFIVNQLACPTPSNVGEFLSAFNLSPSWISRRGAELICTTAELSWDEGDVYTWDDERRFQIRCELDAAFFHLYLPSNVDGTWKVARIADGNVVDETPEQLAALTAPSPRRGMPSRTSWTPSRSFAKKTKRRSAAT